MLQLPAVRTHQRPRNALCCLCREQAGLAIPESPQGLWRPLRMLSIRHRITIPGWRDCAQDMGLESRLPLVVSCPSRSAHREVDLTFAGRELTKLGANQIAFPCAATCRTILRRRVYALPSFALS